MRGDSQSELDELRAKLVDLERAHHDFLAQLSHELRTPLHAIVGWSEILLAEENPHDAAQLRRALLVILRNAKVQVRLIEEMLDVSSLVRGSLQLRRAPLSLDPIVQAAIDSVSSIAQPKQIALQAVLCAPDDAVLVDGQRMQQVAWNLISNAIKFAPSQTSIAVRTYREGEHVCLEVEDAGSGIEPELLPQIFDRFRQGRAANGKGGLGLGLAIVKGLVELHDGEVMARNTNRGALFLVRLPALSGAPCEDLSSRPPSLAPAPSALLGARISIVDDEPDAIELLRTALERAGARVRAFHGPQALLASQLHADALILDIGMDALSGLELLTQLRERGVTAPAIALTAHAMERDRRSALQAGFQRHIAKPVDVSELLASVASVLRPHG